jgi:hypothetical protein
LPEHHEQVLRSSVQTIHRYRTATDHLLRFLQTRPIRWQAIALDGKVLKGSANGQTPGVHLLSAFVPAAAAVLAQIRAATTTNEHKAAWQLLDMLPLRGKFVPGDAIFTQRDLAGRNCLAGGDYVPIAKDNQSELAAATRRFMVHPRGSAPPPPLLDSPREQPCDAPRSPSTPILEAAFLPATPPVPAGRSEREESALFAGSAPSSFPIFSARAVFFTLPEAQFPLFP